jgi:phage terminase large subunit-like protein
LLPGEMEPQGFNQNKLRVRLFNGSIIQGYSAETPDRIRGANLSGLWYDEAGSSRYPEFWYASARPAVRIGRARIVVTTTPRNTKLLRDLTSRTDGSVHVTVGRMWENDRLDEGMAEDLRREYMGTRLGRQELEGEMLGDFEGALISRDGIDKHRIPRESIPLLSRVVVGVDPAMKAGEDHDESGIVVAGEGAGPDGELHAFIIDDRSFRGTPNQVMEQVAAAVRKWEADCVVLETNQGGQWVRDTLRTVDSGIPVREVHAMKSKVLRAERVSALFEQGKIHMAGTFPELEDELCQLVPGEVPVRSPDRAVAAVYAIFELRHLGQGGSWLSAYGMATCPNCKATLGVKRLKCPECGHERQADPEPEPRADAEPKGWAAAYAPRQHVNQVDQVASMLRQYGQGNFDAGPPGRTPGLGRIWKRGWQ